MLEKVIFQTQFILSNQSRISYKNNIFIAINITLRDS